MNPVMPSWTKQPQKLSISELENPETVFLDFFEKYDLPLFRAEFNDWLDQAPQFLRFYQEIEKVVEATWAIVHYKKDKY